MSPGPFWLIDSSSEIHLRCLCGPNDVENQDLSQSFYASFKYVLQVKMM